MSSGISNIVVCADDTDVLVLLVAQISTFNADIYMKSGTSSKVKITHVNKVASRLGLSVCEALSGLHAFTGCDSVSAFSGKGKIGALKLMRKHVVYQEAFKLLGAEFTLSESLIRRN